MDGHINMYTYIAHIHTHIYIYTYVHIYIYVYTSIRTCLDPDILNMFLPSSWGSLHGVPFGVRLPRGRSGGLAGAGGSPAAPGGACPDLGGGLTPLLFTGCFYKLGAL